MVGINVQAKEALEPYLGTIREQLVAAPPKPRAWVSAKPTGSATPPEAPRRNAPTDPALRLLDELIKMLATASSITERVDTVEQLARLMRRCQAIVLELESVHKFSAIRLTLGKENSVKFSNLRGCIQLASRYYDRLQFYKTAEGKNFLKGVVSVKPDLDRKGDVAVRDHHFDERLDPLAAVRSWKYDEPLDPLAAARSGKYYQEGYLQWAKKQYQDNSDPIEHIVEYLIGETAKSSMAISNILAGVNPTQARLNPLESVGDFLNVEVRTHVKGDERFSDPRGAPRIWTYQVKVPGRVNSNQDADKYEGRFEWTCNVWFDNAASLPILRVVDSPSIRRSGINNDFTRGTLYAMQGPSLMRCFPATKFHTALFDSEVTSAAGILVAQDGRVVAIDNRSGHYQPGYRQLKTAVQFLHSSVVFEHDAFVSVHVSNDDEGTKSDADALYFSPADFLIAAQSGMNFNVVAGFVAELARRYGYRLPVAARHADLIPPTLRDFPMHKGRNRWDRMLASYYGGNNGLETIVADFKAALKPMAAPASAAKVVIGRREGSLAANHPSLASQTLRAIEAGGAYCRLPELLRSLVAATRTFGGQVGSAKDQSSLLQAHHRYASIEKRLATLKPDRQHF